MSRPGHQPGGGAVPEREAGHSASVRVLSLGVALWPGCSPAGGWPGGLGALPASSPHLRPLTPQMTAWARWSWTSGRTSPSSRIRPASESEPPPRDARRLLPSPPGAFSFLSPTFYFALFVCVPIPHLLPPISSFSLSPLPSSPQRPSRPRLQDPILPSPLSQPGTREPLLCLPRTRPLGSGRDSGF